MFLNKVWTIKCLRLNNRIFVLYNLKTCDEGTNGLVFQPLYSSNYCFRLYIQRTSISIFSTCTVKTVKVYSLNLPNYYRLLLRSICELSFT